jgi:BASS family bile acid:Na+ symporter
LTDDIFPQEDAFLLLTPKKRTTFAIEIFRDRAFLIMSIIKFIKDWTLPVAMALGTLIYLIFAFVPVLDSAATFFSPVCDTILPLFMFLILFVTFCKVDFHKLIPVKWHFWVGVFQVIFVAFVMAIILLFHLRGNNLIVMEAMLTCIIGPCAAAAAVVTAKLGGSLEEMTTYTFISNFITAALIPVCFPMIEKGAGISFLAAFMKILYEVCVVLLLPMLLAFIVKHGFKRFHRWVISIKDLSYYLWGASLMMVTGTTVKNIVHANTTVWLLLIIAALALLLCIAQFAVGRWIGSHFKNTVNAGQALGQKNTAFAIWIAYSYLNPLSSVGPGCYILWQNVINSIEIWDYRRRGLERTS